MTSQYTTKQSSRKRAGFEPARFKSHMRPVHPGEILKEDFLEPARLSVQLLANALHVPASCIDDIVLQRCGITAETAMRLARYFGGDAKSWLGLQTMYDLHVAWRTSAREIERDVVPAGWGRP